MRILKIFVIFLICAVTAAFAAHNANYVDLNFYPYGLKISIAAFFLIFICLLFGVLLSAIIVSTKFIQHRRIVKIKNRQIDALEKELATYRPTNRIV